MTKVNPETMKGNSKNRFPKWTSWILLLFSAALFGLIFYSSSPEESEATPSEAKIKTKGTTEIVQGIANEIPYYHCSGKGGNKVVDVVLLHGAHFTKENWKTSGILEKLCAIETLSVTALDLSVRAKHKELEEVLQGLADKNLVKLPIAAIVTPSASGSTIVDFMNSGSVNDIKKYFSRWIPVASPAVMSATTDELAKLKDISLPILAIHGDKDASGRKTSERLHSEAGATVVELEGRHPCYLDSPDAFIKSVLKFLNVSNDRRL